MQWRQNKTQRGERKAKIEKDEWSSQWFKDDADKIREEESRELNVMMKYLKGRLRSKYIKRKRKLTKKMKRSPDEKHTEV